jgi:hypothetical protein
MHSCIIAPQGDVPTLQITYEGGDAKFSIAAALAAGFGADAASWNVAGGFAGGFAAEALLGKGPIPATPELACMFHIMLEDGASPSELRDGDADSTGSSAATDDEIDVDERR